QPADKELPFDNVRYATFEVRGPRQVLTITDDDKGAAFWREALTSGGAFGCDVKSAAEADKLYPRELRDRYQAICLLSVAGPGHSLWDKLRAYVQDGGG